MNRFKNLTGILALSLLILAAPTIASAQYRGNRNDDYYGNNRNNRNLNATIKNLKNNSRQFERRLDRELDHSRYDGGNREDNLNRLAGDFADTVKRLDGEYDNRGDYNKSRDEVQRVLQLGNRLDRAFKRSRLSGNAQNDWNRIRQDLNILANAYNYDNRRDNDDNNRNRNRRGNSGY